MFARLSGFGRILAMKMLRKRDVDSIDVRVGNESLIIPVAVGDIELVPKGIRPGLFAARNGVDSHLPQRLAKECACNSRCAEDA